MFTARYEMNFESKLRLFRFRGLKEYSILPIKTGYSLITLPLNNH